MAAAARVAPKTAIRASIERIGQTGLERRLRPDDDQLARLRPGQVHDRAEVHRGDVHAAHPWLLGDARAARGDDHLVDARLPGELPGQRVLPTATADDQHPGRHHEAHAGRLGRLRIGRHARSIVWVRSGPTETSTIGTPACASMADR